MNIDTNHLMEQARELLDKEIGGTTYELLLYGFGILLLTFMLRRFITRRMIGVLERLAVRVKVPWYGELLRSAHNPISTVILLAGVWTALTALDLPSKPHDWPLLINRLGRIALIIIMVWFFFRTMDTIHRILQEKAEDPKHWMDTSLVPLITMSLKILVVVITIMLVAQNMGYSVSGIVASLGIGGIAVALAARDTLANFFGSMMLLIDRPFKPGQWIKAGDGAIEGFVEEVGFRSTKIRTFAKTVLVIPNDKLANMTVENMDRMKDPHIGLRRQTMTVGVEYKTTADQMENLLADLRAMLAEHTAVDQNFSVIRFTEFGDSSLNIFFYFFIRNTAWLEWLGVCEDINLKVMRIIKEHGLAVAFPTRTLHIEPPSAAPLPPAPDQTGG